ncbi:S9 family peptidase [Chryseobacterium joostei]|uniref:Dipeptidyl aminopeptidase/acylaminoacyl peptidase n=1 Tax=Chryseobacterium joostei TaxID=112234 RepID=A0A1N7HTA8_9FLAO|nr:prolyl oligopeptidase family serine peptidase [Chryseobacterium joostei]AZA99182.1 S9 family peptidase [Chryseobacterium joostei]SIS28056.1 Dipeptidyl aminopeptidase/acylaminoacyl peptidase [Chryseobacterium joostei]
MLTIIKILLLFTGCICVSGQSYPDTITAWKTKFAKLGGAPKLSPAGKWISINKFSRNATDTTYVAESLSGKNLHKIVGSATFLNDQLVIGKNRDNVEVINLQNGSKSLHENISNVYALTALNRYALLTRAKTIEIYDQSGKLEQLNNIEGFGINKQNRLYVVRKVENSHEIWDLSSKHIRCAYSTPHNIRKTDISISGDKLFITEGIKGEPDDQLVIVGTTGTDIKIPIPKLAEISFTEIQKGKAFLLEAKVKFDEIHKEDVEIWYGNDTYLGQDKLYFKAKSQKFWFYNPTKSIIKELTSTKGFEVKALNNERFFLTYIPRKDFNYLTSNLSPEDLNDAHIYDSFSDTFIPIGNFKAVRRLNRRKVHKTIFEQVISSPDGTRFIASTDGLKWTLFHVSGKTKRVIDKEGLELPVFSQDGENIFFESSDDLWIYNLKKEQLSPMNIAHGQITRIKDNVYKNDNRAPSLSVQEPLLVEGYSLLNNTTSYYLIENRKSKTVIPSTDNRINHIVFDQKFRNFYTVEENFNKPPFLRHYSGAKTAKIIMECDGGDKNANRIKQEIITFDAIGKKLNGILYYPTNFDPKRIYPMVVHIYQRQRQESNEYLSPNNEFPVGFQIRTLIERGYFVFLPDILYNDSGTGLSALECVERGLDRVLKNPNINATKIGLGGHSHGGYETNFIATHSNRFATYVSGAGNSDIIRSYYSYNYNFISPFYWQFENEQYELGKSVAEDKSLYLKNSPILNVEKVNAPILLWAGKKDENIQWDQVMEFFIGLKRYKKNVIALFYPNQSHAFINGTSAEQDLSTRIIQWWDYYLKNEKNIDWINQLKKDAD